MTCGRTDRLGHNEVMAKTYDRIEDRHREWIEEQHLFFVATAPSGPDGHVNLSPKGYDTFRVLDDRTVAYLDLTGSGVETIAHLRQNGRLTIMFCAFEGRARVLRLYGQGRVAQPGSPEWDELAPHFDLIPGARAIIRLDVDRVSTSCGYAVPFMDYRGERETAIEWAEKKGPDGVARYHDERNAESIDGLPGMG
jgi:hypothetical protein